MQLAEKIVTGITLATLFAVVLSRGREVSSILASLAAGTQGVIRSLVPGNV